jgi:hypothetical protein
LKHKLLTALARVGLIAFGIGLSLLLLEVAFRFLYPDPSPKLVNQGLQFHPLYRLAFTPNTEGWNTSLRGEYSTYIKINSKGLRGREYPYQKDKNTFRILVLGDSFTAGLQVSEEETFSKLLESRLQQHYPQTKIEVINAGVVGYGTENELAYFTHEGYKYQPDVVLLAFFTGNDLTDNIWNTLYDLKDGGLIPNQAAPPVNLDAPPWNQQDSSFRHTRDFIYTHSRLYSASIELLTLAVVQKAPALAELLVSVGLVELTRPIVNAGNLYAFRYLPTEAWLKTEALIKELNREVEARQGRLVVAILPDESDVNPARRAEIQQAYASLTADKINPGPPPALQLAQQLQADKILNTELLTPLQQYQQQRDEPLYFRYDGHWTPAGHWVASQAIFNYLVAMEEQLYNFPTGEKP